MINHISSSLYHQLSSLYHQLSSLYHQLSINFITNFLITHQLYINFTSKHINFYQLLLTFNNFNTTNENIARYPDFSFFRPHEKIFSFLGPHEKIFHFLGPNKIFIFQNEKQAKIAMYPGFSLSMIFKKFFHFQ